MTEIIPATDAGIYNAQTLPAAPHEVMRTLFRVAAE
jgi:hypothetical protein